MATFIQEVTEVPKIGDMHKHNGKEIGRIAKITENSIYVYPTELNHEGTENPYYIAYPINNTNCQSNTNQTGGEGDENMQIGSIVNISDTDSEYIIYAVSKDNNGIDNIHCVRYDIDTDVFIPYGVAKELAITQNTTIPAFFNKIITQRFLSSRFTGIDGRISSNGKQTQLNAWFNELNRVLSFYTYLQSNEIQSREPPSGAEFNLTNYQDILPDINGLDENISTLINRNRADKQSKHTYKNSEAYKNLPKINDTESLEVTVTTPARYSPRIKVEEQPTPKPATPPLENRTTNEKEQIVNDVKVVITNKIDKIKAALLNRKNINNSTLLNDIKYTEAGTITTGDVLGHLFNMEYTVDNKQITEVNLSYNILGFYMLLTELQHDFIDVPKVKTHLPIINQNFVAISKLMMEKVPNNVDNNNNLELWNKLFGDFDAPNKNAKFNPKLSEEEMGHIVSTLLSNDDMPRLVVADEKVNIQYYAPVPVKGTMPPFYSIQTPVSNEVKVLNYTSNSIRFTSDADNKSAYIIPKTSNLYPNIPANYPLLKLDAGSSPQYKIASEWSSWFTSLGSDNENTKTANVPNIVVKNPLNGTNLITITYANKQFDLNITAGVHTIQKIIKDLNKTAMSELIVEGINTYNTNITPDSQLFLFAVSILKSLGDLVCYITVNMQKWLEIHDTDQADNSMFLCNSADYSMYYPMLGHFRFKDTDGNYLDELEKNFQNSSTYLSCSVKSVQNFFTPLSLRERKKLMLVKYMYETGSFTAIKNILSFNDMLSNDFTKLIIQEEIQHMSTEGDSSISISINLPPEHNANITLIQKRFLMYRYLSSLYHDGLTSPPANVAQLDVMSTLKTINTNICNRLVTDLRDINRMLSEYGLIEPDPDSDSDSDSDSAQANEKENELDKLDKIRTDEMMYSLFSGDDVQYNEISLHPDDWKYMYLYAEFLLKLTEDYNSKSTSSRGGKRTRNKKNTKHIAKKKQTRKKR
uniref:Uncharacterized protein n=1 Tax=viral metagenome TaxID=1070528 RepID=A0A6C0IRP6_9ZZZZ